MPAKKHKPEEIIGKLREVEIVLGQGGRQPAEIDSPFLRSLLTAPAPKAVRIAVPS